MFILFFGLIEDLRIPFIADTASGISVDHMYGGFNTPIAYTYEFRDPDHGFILPPEYIIPNCEEVVDSLIGLVSRSREHGYLGGTSKV